MDGAEKSSASDQKSFSGILQVPSAGILKAAYRACQRFPGILRVPYPAHPTYPGKYVEGSVPDIPDVPGYVVRAVSEKPDIPGYFRRTIPDIPDGGPYPAYIPDVPGDFKREYL